MAMVLLPVILILVAALLIFSVFGSAFSTLTTGGDVVYNEEAYQDYANDMYYKEFGAAAAFEDNLLLVLLVEEDYYDYNFIAWVGDDIQTDINYMFGNESSELGRAIAGSAINGDSYKYSMGQGISQVMDTMGDKIEALGLDSSFICDEEHIGVDSHITNYTDLTINTATVERALDEFTTKTGIPVVVVIEYQEAVFGKTISGADIVSLIIAIALIALGVVLFVKFFKKRKQQNYNGTQGN